MSPERETPPGASEQLDLDEVLVPDGNGGWRELTPQEKVARAGDDASPEAPNTANS